MQTTSSPTRPTNSVYTKIERSLKMCTALLDNVHATNLREVQGKVITCQNATHCRGLAPWYRSSQSSSGGLHQGYVQKVNLRRVQLKQQKQCIRGCNLSLPERCCLLHRLPLIHRRYVPSKTPMASYTTFTCVYHLDRLWLHMSISDDTHWSTKWFFTA